MTNFLSREAAQDYFLLTIRSHEYGIIDVSIVLERLAALSSLGNSAHGATVFANEILHDHDWTKGDNDWFDDRSGRETSELSENHHGRSADRQLDDESDDRIHLAIAVGGINWIFHPFDDDWFPSVPHGHKRSGRPTDKLDPYLGWVYDKSKQTGRLKRKDIITLWNNEGFRVTASRSIDYYLENHPHVSRWRVRNPRKLPLRR